MPPDVQALNKGQNKGGVKGKHESNVYIYTGCYFNPTNEQTQYPWKSWRGSKSYNFIFKFRQIFTKPSEKLGIQWYNFLQIS